MQFHYEEQKTVVAVGSPFGNLVPGDDQTKRNTAAAKHGVAVGDQEISKVLLACRSEVGRG